MTFFQLLSCSRPFVENVISLLYDTCAFYLEGTNFAYVKLRYKGQYRQSNINRHQILNNLHIFPIELKKTYITLQPIFR